MKHRLHIFVFLTLAVLLPTMSWSQDGTSDGPLPKVHIIATGGTIAGTSNDIGYDAGIYGREYYEGRWDTRELKQKLDTALTIKVALAITNRPRAAKLYLPLLRGQKIKFAIIMGFADILVRKFN